MVKPIGGGGQSVVVTDVVQFNGMTGPVVMLQVLITMLIVFLGGGCCKWILS
jgi:hypothetical protein